LIAVIDIEAVHTNLHFPYLEIWTVTLDMSLLIAVPTGWRSSSWQLSVLDRCHPIQFWLLALHLMC
jgi:hypothetical protein